jgi:hypothetical protein
MRLGIADHFGWAVAVTASPDHRVVDRRRIELVEAGVTQAPIHYDRGRLSVTETAELVAEVRLSVARASDAALTEIASAVPEPIVSMSLRAWPPDFPDDIAVLVRPPWEARADAVMYRTILAELARARGWDVHLYDAKTVLTRAAQVLGPRTADILDAPRTTLGPPWTKDHRQALAATVLASGDRWRALAVEEVGDAGGGGGGVDLQPADGFGGPAGGAVADPGEVDAVGVGAGDQVGEGPAGGVGGGDAGAEVAADPAEARGPVEAEARAQVAADAEHAGPAVRDLDVGEDGEPLDEP